MTRTAGNFVMSLHVRIDNPHARTSRRTYVSSGWTGSDGHERALRAPDKKDDSTIINIVPVLRVLPRLARHDGSQKTRTRGGWCSTHAARATSPMLKLLVYEKGVIVEVDARL